MDIAAVIEAEVRSLDAIHLATADHLLASGKHLSASSPTTNASLTALDLGVVITAPGQTP